MSAYYFPIDELEDGSVYTYVSLSDPPLLDAVWYYKALKSDSIDYLVGQTYDENWRVTQLVVEKTTPLGMVTDSVQLFIPDSTNRDLPVEVKVTNRATYPFYRNSNDTLLYQIQWTDPGDGLQYTLDRKRIYVKDTTISYQNELLEAVVFQLEEELETFTVDDGATNSAWSGMEIYGKNVGLVYYRKEIGDFVRAYRLSEVTDGDTFFETLETTLSKEE